jgi:HK97 family phage portal protein
MGFLDRILPWRRKDTSTSTNPSSWFVDWIHGGEPTLSGIAVTPESAMRLAAVWACIRVRSEDVAKIPCLLYRRLPDGGKERATDHALYNLINLAPNPRMTAFDFRQMMQAELDLRGNALALKDFDLRGRVTALWPIPWKWVQVFVTPDWQDVFYRITRPYGAVETLPADAVMHLRGISLDGIVGLSPIAHHRETIGLAVAAEKYGAAFFGNSAQPRGAVKLPGVVDEATAKKLREDWERKYRGVENSHRIAIFDGGMDWVATGLTNVDAEYINTRKMQNQEIWRIYRVPAHKVGDLERSTYSNIEMQSLEYVTDCLMTEFRRWEQTLGRDLLTEQEQQQYFFEFLPDALLKGDTKSRYDAYAVARNWGILNANEIRELENRNHYPDGDVYLQPLNMAPAGTFPAPPQPNSNPNPNPDNLPPASAKALLKLAMELVAREESDDVVLPSPFEKRHANGNGSGHAEE